MALRPRFTSMTVGLAFGITAAVVLPCALGAYLYSRHHFQALLEAARGSALAEGELIRIALEHQMIENDRSLIGRMVQSFGQQPHVKAVMLLDRQGIERYTSLPRTPGLQLHIESPTCQACHRLPPEQRDSARVIETDGGTVLRSVVPIRNRPQCYGCHDASHRVNGILILDHDAGGIRAAMNRDLQLMVLGSGALAALLVGAIAFVIRFVVLRRLQRFETTARLIAAGDLDQRVAVSGSDTLSWLAKEFNAMADSVTGLVGEVRTQRSRLETIINSIDDGIVVLDGKRTVVAANEAFVQRTGRYREQVMNSCCLDAAPGMCGAAGCPTTECLQTGESQTRILERRGADGTAYWEEVHSSPIRDQSGALTHVVEVWRDISNRRAAEARLAESHRLASLGLLASGFSHELNTPLATVLTCVEAILREARAEGADAPGSARITENAAIARDQVLRCRGITQHFLRLSRGQKSAGDIVDLSRTVAAVERLVSPTARAHSVTIRVEPMPGDMRVRADESELQHALVNLLINAVQACSAGGEVVLSAQGAGDEVRLRVTDNGCGVASEHQSRIFEPFFSLRKGGTGLGLFLALNFVRRWGGDIVVRSSPGAGATFEIALPRLAPAVERRSA